MIRRRTAITWIDTLKLTDEDHRELLEELEANVQPAAHELRAGSRHPYDLSNGLLMKVFSAGSSPIHYLVRPRNISAGGIGILHGNYLHVGTRCTIALRKPANHCVSVSGSVAWCRHFRGRVHELGIKFAQPIVVEDFIHHATAASGQAGTPATTVKLAGRVLLVGASIDDQELVRFYLSSMGVDLLSTTDALAALSHVESSTFQLVIVDDALTGMNPTEFTTSLHEQGARTPVVLMTADASSAPTAPAMAGVLCKPFTVDDMVKAVAMHLPPSSPAHCGDGSAGGAGGASGGGPIFSENWSCTQMRPVILGFLGRLQAQVQDLTRLADDKDGASVFRKRCQDLKGSAGGYGYPQISRAAHELLDALERNARESITQSLKALTQMCSAAARVRSADEEPVSQTVASP